MKTKLLIAASLAGLGLWAAAQGFQLSARYQYRRAINPPAANPAYKGSLSVVTRRGGLNFFWLPDRGERVSLGESRVLLGRAPPVDSENVTVRVPDWVKHDDGDGIVSYVLFLPYWLFAGPPALLLAWQLWRRRLAARRGFPMTV